MKVKRWLVVHKESLTYIGIFVLMVAGMSDFWWSSFCTGVAWFLVLKQWDKVKFWRKKSWYEHLERIRLEEALERSGMRMVTSCLICHQDVLDFDEHYMKVHTEKKEKR